MGDNGSKGGHSWGVGSGAGRGGTGVLFLGITGFLGGSIGVLVEVGGIVVVPVEGVVGMGVGVSMTTGVGIVSRGGVLITGSLAVVVGVVVVEGDVGVALGNGESRV